MSDDEDRFLMRGHDLARAAARAMGWSEVDGTWVLNGAVMARVNLWLPDQDANADYMCLEYAEANFTMSDLFPLFKSRLEIPLWFYLRGAWARALVETVEEDKRQHP